MPFIGLGTILMNNKCPKCRTLTKDLSILKQNGDWRDLEFLLFLIEVPEEHIPKCLRTSSKPTLKHYVQLSCYDIIILHNCWVRFLELKMYLESKPLGGKKVHTAFWRRTIYLQARSCFKEVTWNSMKALDVLYACSKLMF